MNAALVIGISGTIGGKPKMCARICPCNANPMSHAATNDRRPVNMPWMMTPVNKINTGKIQFQTPVEIFGEMIRRRKANLREQHQRQRHAEIGRIENMLCAAFANGSAEQHFRTDGKRDRENKRPEPFVRIYQHRAGETGNERGGQRIEEIRPTAGPAHFTVLRRGVHPFQKKLEENPRADGDESRGVRLLEAENHVAENIPDNHQRP